MHRLTEFAVRERSVVLLLAVGMFLAGLFSWGQLRQELLPDIELPIVTVIATLPGASAEDVAARAVPMPEGHSAYTPREACQKAADVGLDCQPANDIGAALEDLLATQPAPMRILICGSLYLAGDVLARNG